ncbi:MAG: glycosyltransferase family 39 protein, partial [Opitutaceae bacterium]
MSTTLTPFATRKSNRRVFCAVACLLALHFLMSVSASRDWSTTNDELAHLTGGHTYWAFNDYRMHSENGNLSQRWEAIPALIFGWKLPDPATSPNWSYGEVWRYGGAYFYDMGNPLDRMLLYGRAMNALWSVATGLLIFLWSRRLFGASGAFVSLVFFVFCPNFLAHGALATSDMCMTFFFMASAGIFWRLLHETRPALLLASAAVFGLACVAKYSAVLLTPLFVILMGLRLLGDRPLAWKNRGISGAAGRISLFAGITAVHAAVAVAVIWLFFGFKHLASGPGVPPMLDYMRPAAMVREHLGGLGDFIFAITRWHLLPDAFVYGFGHVLDLGSMRGCFLNGEYGLKGFVSFFPYAFLIKSPLSFLLACALSSIVVLLTLRRNETLNGTLKRLWRWCYPVLPLIVFFALYWAISLPSHLNIGHRHILPIYPVLFIGLGLLGPWCLKTGKLAIVAVAILVAGQMIESVSIRPHYIAFFNVLIGGPAQGYRHLVDSSLDWGQDLPGLTRWLQTQGNRRPDEPVYVSYFATGNPWHYIKEALPLPCIPRLFSPDVWPELKPGLYCVSATMLQQVYNSLQGPW